MKNRTEYTMEDSGHLHKEGIKVRVDVEDYGIFIGAEGYGDFATSADEMPPIICVELREGQIRLLYWDDINEEGPTWIAGFEKAREENRKLSQ